MSSQIRKSYGNRFLACVIMMILPFIITDACPQPNTIRNGRNSNLQQLDKAMPYFQSGKYHEALLLFEPLMHKDAIDKRTTAFLGVCYYYEGEYAHAIQCFEHIASEIDCFAPGEQSVYYFCAAESMLHMKRYQQAIPLYQKYIVLCHPNEKATAYYSMGICYMNDLKWSDALKCFTTVKEMEQQYNTISTERMQKLQKMMDKCALTTEHGTSFAY